MFGVALQLPAQISLARVGRFPSPCFSDRHNLADATHDIVWMHCDSPLPSGFPDMAGNDLIRTAAAVAHVQKTLQS